MCRAVLLRVFARLCGPVAALLLSSLCFGLAHLSYQSWRDVVLILVNADLPVGLASMMTGRLWLPVGLHLGYDFCEGSLLASTIPKVCCRAAPTQPTRRCLPTEREGRTARCSQPSLAWE